MNIFKRKKKVDTVSMSSDSNELIVKILSDHLDMIHNLRKNDKIICDAIVNQQKAIKDLEKQVNELQKLINKAES